MTWIVGANTMFGYGVMVSDVCVTLGDGRRLDVLRKAYPVGQFVMAGFAGSVRIGLRMIEELRRFLHLPDEEKDGCWQLAWVAEHFMPIARSIFEQCPNHEQNSGCHLMLVGVDPAENMIGGGKSVIAVLRSPFFAPEIETHPSGVSSIGSGTGQTRAMELLRRSVSNFDLMKLEVMNPGAFGRAIASGMTRDLFFDAPPGVSRHLHVSIIGINSFGFTPSDMEYHPREGESVALRMPKVAENWSDLCQMLGLSPDSASGIQALVTTRSPAATHVKIQKASRSKNGRLSR